MLSNLCDGFFFQRLGCIFILQMQERMRNDLQMNGFQDIWRIGNNIIVGDSKIWPQCLQFGLKFDNLKALT